MADIVTDILQLDFTFLLYIILELAVLAGLYWWSRSWDHRWRTVVNLGIIILVIRIILFQNPLAWYVYHHTLDPEVIGWRQSSMLYDEFEQYKDHDDIKYLALGSSQTGAIYEFSEDNLSNFAVKSLAGLGPVGFYMYRYEILNYHPEKILLYLSDFDMGRNPAITSIKLSPAQGIHLPNTLLKLNKYFSGERFTRTVKGMLVGELFPEYKYSFVFQGYIDQLFNKNEAFPTAAARMSPEDRRKYQFKQLRTVINKESIGTNLYYLKKFVSFFEKRDVTITILEGQYNPDAYNKNNLAVKKEVRQKFRDLENSHANVNFISASQLVWFESKDFTDAYHVNRQAGRELVQRVKHLRILGNGTTNEE